MTPADITNLILLGRQPALFLEEKKAVVVLLNKIRMYKPTEPMPDNEELPIYMEFEDEGEIPE